MSNEMETAIDEFEIARNYVRADEKELRRKYGDDYIAVLFNKDVDHDKDEIKLATRIEEKFRDKPVLIGTIDDILNPKEEHLPSPEGEW